MSQTRSATTDTQTPYLAGKLLIATPAMQDPRFARAVIYVCSHSDDEAMGLIINESYDGLSLSGLLEGMELPGLPTALDGPVLAGGPVECERGFILHPTDYFNSPSSFTTSDTLTLTTTKDILEQLTDNTPPSRVRMSLGYSGWSAGQLEQELMQNAWLVAPGDDALVFDTELSTIWTKALASLGINLKCCLELRVQPKARLGFVVLARTQYYR